MKLHVVLLLLCAVIATPARSSPSNTSKIYDAVAALASEGCPTLVVDRTDVSGIDADSSAGFAKHLNVPGALAREFARVNQSDVKLDWSPRKDAVEFVGKPERWDEAAINNVIARASGKHTCVHYVYSFSAPAISGADAILKVNRYCSGMCGGGSDVLRLQMKNGAWRVTAWRRLSIS